MMNEKELKATMISKVEHMARLEEKMAEQCVEKAMLLRELADVMRISSLEYCTEAMEDYLRVAEK